MNVKSLWAVPFALVILSSPAAGQEATDTPPKFYLTATGGAAFDVKFDDPTATFAVEWGERLHHDVQAYANLGYVSNLMSDRMEDNLVLAGDTLTAIDGVLWEFKGRDRGIAFTVGGKWLAPIKSRMRPYIGGGFGLLNLQREITERDLGDVSEGFFLLTGLNDGVFDAGDTSTTKPLGEILIGVSGAIGRAYLDVGYRYRKAFNSFEPIEFGQVTVGVGVAWH